LSSTPQNNRQQIEGKVAKRKCMDFIKFYTKKYRMERLLKTDNENIKLYTKIAYFPEVQGHLDPRDLWRNFWVKIGLRF
jgi:hypothetical protein